MRKIFSFISLLLILIISTITSYAQTTTVSGSVKNSKSKEIVAAVSVTIKGTSTGTFTDDNGNFKFTTTQKPPFVLVFSSVGFTEKEVAVSQVADEINVEIAPSYALGDEVVVAASRVPEKILESPVSIERVSVAAIRNAVAPSYYDVIGNLKGVDITTSSLTFKSISTRGFNGSGNLRLNQIVDGMDNQAPGLNFSVGAIIGLTELDVDNMELLSGASSALYGPGGMNGTLLINSKNPFKYQGFSFQVKQGVNHIDNIEHAPGAYYDWSLRWAKKLNDRLAFKINAQFIQAQDWIANNTSNYDRSGSTGAPFGQVKNGTRTSDPNYDGVNVYGDETTQGLQGIAASVRAAAAAAGGPTLLPTLDGAIGAGYTLSQFQGLFTGPLAGLASYAPILYGSNSTKNYFNGVNVSRTGYNESDVVVPTTLDAKLSGGIYYKLTNNIEASLSAYWGTGNTVYTGSDRYSLKNMKMGQYKAEIKSKDWFVRAYATLEDAGDSYNATIAARYFNEAWMPSTTWYPTYMSAYTQYIAAGLSLTDAANAARGVADKGRPGGPIYNNPLFQKIVQTPISKGGALFLDKTSLYNLEGQYNLTDALGLGKTKTEFLVGGNWKRYWLNSEGTLFADKSSINPGKIMIEEIGAYGQLSQRLLNDVLKLTVSGRYDKNQNFDPRFTPRASAVIKIAKDNNLRFSYQEAYRFPSTQNQWISLVVGGNTILSGGLQQMIDYYKLNSSPVYNANGLVTFSAIKPERSSSYEFGYKGLLTKQLMVDAYMYYATYNDFITTKNGQQLATGKLFSVAQNADGTVKTNGWGVSVEYLLPHNYNVNANIYSDQVTDQPSDPNFVSYFNTPKTRFNLGLSNSGFGPKGKYGFGVIYKWQDAFLYQGSFAVGQVPAFGVVDAMVSYKLSDIKSLIKVGATNLFNTHYINGFGNANVGGLYYISFGYNVF
ncbi:TonB-dependent receptor SusC precursor [mine drainage metagenome]|uniref:TonB-dependent receptor SusC n=1 Tax=mine drainage metagenome TaxID=410659 RepID=A0A1J5SZ17_9ZZZZ